MVNGLGPTDRRFDRVMLGGPGNLEAALLSYLHEFERIACNLPHIRPASERSILTAIENCTQCSSF
jgi:hypothetical protein